MTGHGKDQKGARSRSASPQELGGDAPRTTPPEGAPAGIQPSRSREGNESRESLAEQVAEMVAKKLSERLIAAMQPALKSFLQSGDAMSAANLLAAAPPAVPLWPEGLQPNLSTDPPTFGDEFPKLEPQVVPSPSGHLPLASDESLHSAERPSMGERITIRQLEGNVADRLLGLGSLTLGSKSAPRRMNGHIRRVPALPASKPRHFPWRGMQSSPSTDGAESPLDEGKPSNEGAGFKVEPANWLAEAEAVVVVNPGSSPVSSDAESLRPTNHRPDAETARPGEHPFSVDSTSWGSSNGPTVPNMPVDGVKEEIFASVATTASTQLPPAGDVLESVAGGGATASATTTDTPSATNSDLKPCPSRRLTNVYKVRQQRVDMIVEHIRDSDALHGEGSARNFKRSTSPYSASSAAPQPPLFLMLCGILPWRQNKWLILCRLYQWMAALLVVAALGIKVLLASMGDIQLVSDLPLPVGAISGMIFLGVLTGSEELQKILLMLVQYSYRVDSSSTHLWEKSRYDVAVNLVIWVVAVAKRVHTHVYVAEETSARHIGGVIAFGLSSFVLLALAFCLQQICRLLARMVDTFCCSIALDQRLEGVVARWNMLQAVLRKTSSTVEHCFFALQTTVFFVLLLAVADGLHPGQDGSKLLDLLPCAAVLLGIARTYFCAAAVTDKCAHVPSLVNSLDFSEESMDKERQYVVDYVVNSAAGFYVFEVRLNSALALKFAHVCGVVVFALAAKLTGKGFDE